MRHSDGEDEMVIELLMLIVDGEDDIVIALVAFHFGDQDDMLIVLSSTCTYNLSRFLLSS